VGLQGLELIVDLLQGEVPDLRGMFAEAFECGDRVLVIGHLHAPLADRPVEEGVQDLAVSVGGGWLEPFGVDHAGDELRDVLGGDSLEASLLDDPYGPLALLDGLLVVSGTGAVLGVLKLLTALTKDRAEVLRIGFGAAFGFGRPHLADIRPHHFADRCFRGDR